jgi:DNA-directed RNA polymerase specialized sigma24 family protein
VATILGKTEGAVKSLQHRALVSLQKHIAKTA